MRMRSLLITIFAFTLAANGQSGDSRLEGCPDPTAIAAALAKLRNSRWQELTTARLQAMWPTELLGASCDSSTERSLESKGRIIGGHYECSEIFLFDVKRGTDRTAPEQLTNLVVHYSTARRQNATATAKIFARALGASESDVRHLGKESQNDFHWESAKDELSHLVVEFSHERTVWTITLNFSRFRK